MAKPKGAPELWVSVNNYILERQANAGVRYADSGDVVGPEWFKETKDHALSITVDGVTRNDDCNVTGVITALAEEIVQNLHKNPDGFTLNVVVNMEPR